MEIRMFDESGGICRPLQSQTQQPCIVHWTPLPGPMSSHLFWDTASEAATGHPTTAGLCFWQADARPLLIPPEKNRNILQEKQKRDNLLNRVAMTLQYISGTYKEKENKMKTKNHSCCYTISPSLTYPLWHFYKPWKFLKTIRLNDIYKRNSFIHLNGLSIKLRQMITSQNLKFITLILHFFITKSFMIVNLIIFSNLQIIWHNILNLAK